jgi:autotransporter-associated beta strand protein
LNSYNGAGTTQTFSGVISGSGSYVRNASTATGGGTTIFTGLNTYAGGTNVSRGTLLVNNPTTNPTDSGTGNGVVTVGANGILGGTGSALGAVTVNSGGIVSPGASIDSFAVGALTFNSGSTLKIELNSNLSFSVGADLLDVSGNLSIAPTGALLAITDAGSTSLTSVKYTLISYSGTWNGNSFASFPDDSTVVIGSNSYVINYNDSTGGTNFGGGAFGNFVTLSISAIPEASSILLGGTLSLALVLAVGLRKTLKTAPATPPANR